MGRITKKKERKGGRGALLIRDGTGAFKNLWCTYPHWPIRNTRPMRVQNVMSSSNGHRRQKSRVHKKMTENL